MSATDHTFLAEEGEERLVLLRGEQQGPHVGDPPRRRRLLRLLLAGAHGVAGGAGSPGPRPRPPPAASGRSPVPPLGDRGGRRGVRGAASRSTPPARGGGGEGGGHGKEEPIEGRAESGRIPAPARLRSGRRAVVLVHSGDCAKLPTPPPILLPQRRQQWRRRPHNPTWQRGRARPQDAGRGGKRAGNSAAD